MRKRYGHTFHSNASEGMMMFDFYSIEQILLVNHNEHISTHTHINQTKPIKMIDLTSDVSEPSDQIIEIVVRSVHFRCENH